MASEAYDKKSGRGGVGLLLLSKGSKGEPDGDEGDGMSDEDYKSAKAEGAKAFFEAATEGDWDKAREELAKVIHLCMDQE